MNKYRRAFLLTIISSLIFQSACTQATTLDRIGAVVVTAVGAFQIEVDQLCTGGQLTPAKCADLKAKGALANNRAQQFAGQLSAFGAITPGNVPALILQISETTAFFQGLLVDSGLSPDSRPVRIITFAIKTLQAAAIVVAGIHPPATRGIGGRPNPQPSAVPVNIPKPDRDVQRALDGAGKRAFGPDQYRELRAEFGLQTGN